MKITWITLASSVSFRYLKRGPIFGGYHTPKVVLALSSMIITIVFVFLII